MKKKYTHRYLVIFKDYGKDHYTTDCGFNDVDKAKGYADRIHWNSDLVKETKVKDQENGSIVHHRIKSAPGR